MKTELLLARHGETIWNSSRRIQGQLDSELTARGKLQAQQLAKKCQRLQLDHIYCSNLYRAVLSAQICQEILNIELAIDARLAERNLGDFQGKYFKDLKQQNNFLAIFQTIGHESPLNGESSYQCQNRISDALISICKKHRNQKLLVIFHGEAMRCFLSKLLTLKQDAYSSFSNSQLFQLYYCHQNQKFELPKKPFL